MLFRGFLKDISFYMEGLWANLPIIIVNLPNGADKKYVK